MATEWLEDIQLRFETDRQLFLQEDLAVPEDAHLQLQNLPTPQLLMMLLEPQHSTLTKMRAKAQFKKRRDKLQYLPGEVYVNCLHLIDFGYSLANLGLLTPAQLISIGMKSEVTDAEKNTALQILRALNLHRRTVPKKLPPSGIRRKRSHSPTMEEFLARQKEAKRSHSPDQLANATVPPRPVAPSPDSQLPSLSSRPLEELTGMMQWVNPGRFAHAIWDPRLYYRQIDFASALETHVEKPKDMVSFSPDEFKVLKYSPNREKLPDLPKEAPSYCQNSGQYDREVKDYLYVGRYDSNSPEKLSWLLTSRHSGLTGYIAALRKVLRLRYQAERVWERLEKEINCRMERYAFHADPVEEHARLVQLLKDDVELAEFFFPDDKPMDYPLRGVLRKRIGNGPFWRLKDASKQWNRFNH